MAFPTSIDLELELKDADIARIGDKTTNDRIALGNVALTSDYSVEVWVKLDQHLTGVRQLAFVCDLPPNDDIVLIASHEGSGPPNLVQTFIRTSSGLFQFIGSKIPPRVWTHLALTYDEGAGLLSLYINGVLDNSEVFAGTLIHPTVNAGIAGNSDGGGSASMGGRVRECRVWTDVRTQAEIVANKDVELGGGESGLLGLWHIDEGTGTLVTDDAGSNDGTLTGLWEANQEGPFWTAITADVISDSEVNVKYGLRGQRPTDRLARPGKMKFVLDNSAGNSGALEGYYSQGHTNQRAGFDIGTRARIHIVNAGSDFYKGYGKIGKIQPRAGTKRSRKTKVVVHDWMVDAQRHKIDLLDAGVNVRSDVLIQSVIDNMTEQPRATSFGVGIETFPFVLDDINEGKTGASSVLTKAVISEFGYLIPIGDQVGGGTLLFQDRHARQKDTTLQLSISGGDVFGLNASADPALIYNIINAKVFPRDVGTTPEVVGQLDTAFELGAGQTETLKINYRDPASQDVQISGQNMQDAEGENKLSAVDRGFETGVGTWFANGTDTDSIAQSSVQAKVGVFSQRLTSGTGAAHTNNTVSGSLIQGFAQNDVVYVQAWVFLEEAWPAGVELGIAEHDSSDVFQILNRVAITTTTGVWIRLSGAYTISDPDTDRIRPVVGWFSNNEDFSGGSVDVYIDEVYLIDDAALNFEFSSADTGGGDKNVDLDLLGSVIGGSAAEYQLTNVGTTNGFVTVLRAVGDAIRKYNPVTRTAEDETSKEDHGDRPIALNLAYQDSPRVADDFGDSTLTLYKDPTTRVELLKFRANRSSALLAAALSVEPGQRIKITETVTGVDTEFFVNGAQLRFFNKQFIECDWSVSPASLDSFWLMGVVGASEIGTTTFVGF